MLGDTSLKNVPFSIVQPATEDDINSLGQGIGELNETFSKYGQYEWCKKFIRSTWFSLEELYIEKIFSS